MNTRAITLAFRLGVRQAIEQPFAVIGQLAVLSALIVSYGALLHALSAADLARLGLTTTQMIWYVVLTEIVAMVSVWHYRQLQQAIRQGQTDVWLLRPIEFWPLLIAEWAGQELPRLLPVAAMGFLLGRIMSGSWGLDFITLILLVPTMALSAMIILCWCFLLGIVTVWLTESSPLFWLYQKLLFVLGALLWPFALYPSWLRMLAWMTPFPAILASVGSLALHQSPTTIALHAADQIFWLCVYLVICAMVARAARRRLAR